MPGVYDREKRTAITRKVSPKYSSALASYFGKNTPNEMLANGSHDAYVAALKAHGTNVVVLPALDDRPDCCFVEDTAVILDDSVVISNMGHPSRVGEEDAIREYLSSDYEILEMPKGGTIDGGDVVFFDDRFLVGISTRTNKLGAEFLSSEIQKNGYETEFINIPESTLHLTTICSSPRQGTIVLAEGHLDPGRFGFVEELLKVPNSESYAANVLGYPEEKVIIANGFPFTRQILMDSGFSITSVDMAPIMEADGSLTCLSLYVK
jgi:dimethylargininase